MSHDTDKLIRQLSLVAFLMAERRPLTARDVKQNVEGYSEMSDEAFARRFYSDRSELLSLGVPLESQRDEFTGEELYTLRSENYFLPPLELTDDELAALQTCLYLLEGQFAYAEPFRLALQNLALGRPGFAQAPTETAVRVEVRDPDYSPELAGRLSKLETAISKQRTLKFDYWGIARDETRPRTIDPYALLPHEGSWYVIGRDHAAEEIRTFRVSRIRGEIRFATRRERDFRLPSEFSAQAHRPPPAWQMGEIVGEARIELSGRHRLVGGAHAPALRAARGQRLRHAVRESRASRRLGAAPRRARRSARARRAAPRGGRKPAGRCANATRAPRRRWPALLPTRTSRWPTDPQALWRRSGSACSRRSSRISSRRAARRLRR